jgi:hypothetical protein
MSELQVEVFRQWVQTLPELGIDLENAVTRILLALNELTRSNAQ